MKKDKSSFNAFFSFIKKTWLDPRIPSRDRVIIGIAIFLIISPFDFIPDFFPIVGILDDLVLLSLILDYFFVRLDEQIILDHFPYEFKRFYNLRFFVKKINKVSPQSMLHWLWKYQPQNSGKVKDAN